MEWGGLGAGKRLPDLKKQKIGSHELKPVEKEGEEGKETQRETGSPRV